jgi:glycosyltransferase involved in cell wall biosynthesis
VLLTRYHPPEISGGARRPHALIRAWRNLGVNVTLVAPEGVVDENLIEVPHPSFPAVPDIAASRKYMSRRLGDQARQALLLPDPEVRWSFRAARRAKVAAREADWIVTTSPPESLHLAGRLLKLSTNTRWLADVRDLWLSDPQLEVRRHPVRRCVETALAKWIMSGCDAISAVSASVEEESLRLSGGAKPSIIIPHFAGPFVGLAQTLPVDTFNIVHTGGIALSNPLSEFHCLLADFEELTEVRTNAHLWLAGHLAREEVAACVASPYTAKIHILGPLAMDQARALQAGADALALVSGRKSHALPGKFSEYYATGLPILLSAKGPWCDLLPADANVMPFTNAQGLAKLTQAHRALVQPDSSLSAAKKLLEFMLHVQSLPTGRSAR